MNRRIKIHNAHNVEQGIVNTVDQMRKGKHPLLLQDLISVLQQTINFNIGYKNVQQRTRNQYGSEAGT